MSDMLDDLRNRLRAIGIGADGTFRLHEAAEPVAGSAFKWRFLGADIQRLLKGAGYATRAPGSDGIWVLTDAGREWLRDATQPTGHKGDE
ncbi:hypothetical protein TSH7_01130 [Azospirillum sp. TSH7]|uniref:hypothetical protein n=1 Tax=unclassified Azospirillum TaxID=2630922 RepID=UPI000D619F01|nr:MULTISPECIES: hypothetical protein [unclassified Azospirillum]PWC69079.1 hypothetical protein TSH7_01130 [Azospirillum sp. TSH7]PWC71429.1 hypothetical protein TSH20_03945 [Azospirillum sp. TSH20]